jgi:hypothetical protein
MERLIMDYQADQAIEKACTPQSELSGQPSKEPSCMREHIDQLQTQVNKLTEMACIRDDRIQKLENLVG